MRARMCVVCEPSRASAACARALCARARARVHATGTPTRSTRTKKLADPADVSKTGVFEDSSGTFFQKRNKRPKTPPKQPQMSVMGTKERSPQKHPKNTPQMSSNGNCVKNAPRNTPIPRKKWFLLGRFRFACGSKKVRKFGTPNLRLFRKPELKNRVHGSKFCNTSHTHQAIPGAMASPVHPPIPSIGASGLNGGESKEENGGTDTVAVHVGTLTSIGWDVSILSGIRNTNTHGWSSTPTSVLVVPTLPNRKGRPQLPSILPMAKP